jgi:urease accessory protein
VSDSPDIAHLQILATWLSPGFPVGAYSYSHGLEWAVESGAVTSPGTLQSWLADLIAHGAGRTDTVLLAHAFRAPDDPAIAELAEALTASAERRHETMAQGAAFARTVAAVWEIPIEPTAYPVAVGRAAARLGLPLGPLAALWLQAFAANIVSAGVRLIPLGQTDGQRITAALMPLVAATAARAIETPLTEIGGIAFRSDLAAMQHETQYTRLYRT